MADDPAKTPEVPGTEGSLMSGRYRLERKLGSGGMSTVYLARDETLERPVAVKVLHREISDQPDQIERFRREARAVAQLSHPNVVAVIDAGEDAGCPYIVFEYVEGETLKQRIDESGKLPLDEAAAYAIEVARGLGAAHARRLVHRDIKPQNVLIDSEGRAKVTDFGIARSLESDGLTATGRVLGTTDYVAPEQAMGQAVDARSDVYSVGVLLYEMLTGEVPFTAETPVGVAMKHVNEQLPDVQRRRPDVSSALAAVVERATAKDPRKRYRDTGELLAELEAALEVEVARAGGSHGEATTVLRSVPRRRRFLPGSRVRRFSLAGIGLVVAGLVVAGLLAGVLGGDGGEAVDPGGGTGGSQVALASVEDFDPQGSPDQAEHPEEVPLATDASTGTVWSTEIYDTADFGGLKDGVGLLLDAGSPVAARELQVLSTAAGWGLEVYAAGSDGGPPSDISGWGSPVASVGSVDTDQTVQLDGGEARYYLLWVTSLPPGGSGYTLEIAELALHT